ncbi:FAD-dependent oxidoreductase [Amycolatopsis sp. K13G38]|uniref:ferredoxin--NADP(+) reductase n=1 Tax=Amycolatopsis acididurans TaxID=2724524 RepID=A0ABX1JAA1_9PSEU|nr:FAD-dependent oxidoreductase [Amycolatopsis acididurans]NKQ56712.1 FAD-dependent oxidoreductase [Amycolatopsis acididurans]
MTFVITQGCCRDASCVSVCPVQCIRPRPGDPEFETAEQLYIDPAVCIDCGACVEECPVDAIHPDHGLPAELSDYLDVNASYFSPISDYDRIPVHHRRPRPPEDAEELRVAVIGTGPAACYAITELATNRGTRVTVLDRQPAPFGLVRSGVAPDHPHTKLIGDRFASVLARPNVHCFFAVHVDTDITVEELLEYHHAVIVATGAQDDRRLGIDGEDLPGSHGAKDFVAWYNGHPDHSADSVDLSGERAVIIGNGNVALDIGRVLSRDPSALSRTDIADHALEALRRSNIREVVIVGRRGPESIACSAGELEELSQLPGVDLTVTCPQEEFAHFESSLSTTTDDSRRRRAQVILNAAASGARRRIDLRFLSVPLALNGTTSVESITLAGQRIDRSGGEPLLVDTGTTRTLEASLVVRAIGFASQPLAGLPFDPAKAILPNRSGRVLEPETGETLAGVYCAGWIKRGPTGVIGSNKVCAEETVAALIDDFAAGRLGKPVRTHEDFAALMNERVPEVVDVAGWQRIDAAERERGAAAGRPRVKFVTMEDMLSVANGR